MDPYPTPGTITPIFKFTSRVPLTGNYETSLATFTRTILHANDVNDFTFTWLTSKFDMRPHGFMIEYHGPERWVPLPAVSRIARFFAECCCSKVDVFSSPTAHWPELTSTVEFETETGNRMVVIHYH
ncbi:hypothetical protein Q8F55_006192 [Vanrija albida]|uniref:Uncharacterized protein n=1 Tax=Vanrija albida TaxID=181172 RepID=A0ABR3PWT8_9TREE